MTLYKILTGLRLATRMRTQVLTAAMIVAVIATGVLILAGLNHGEVTRLTNRLLQSPTSRLVEAWVMQDRAGITASKEAELLQAIPEAELIIPEITKTAVLQNPSNGTETRVSLITSRRGDPLLGFYGIQMPSTGEPVIVLSRSVAEQLGVDFREVEPRRFQVLAQQQIEVVIAREVEGKTDRAMLSVRVVGILETGSAKSATAYMDRDAMDAIESFQNGRAVAAFGWPSAPRPVPVSYTGYVAYTKTRFDQADHQRLAGRGLQADELRSDPRRSFHGLISDADLSVYFVHGSGDTSNSPRLSLAAAEIEDITEADDVVLPWCEPIERYIDQTALTIVGWSGKLRWLKQYCVDSAACFPSNSVEFTLRPARHTGDHQFAFLDRLQIALRSGDEVDLLVAMNSNKSDAVQLASIDEQDGDAPAENGHGVVRQANYKLAEAPLQGSKEGVSLLATVPSAVMAQFELANRGDLVWDRTGQTFTLPDTENVYYKARVYARRLMDVPILAKKLEELGFTTQSERTRVEEIQGYHATLTLIFWVVSVSSAIVGVIALIVVLHDATDRLRGSIGIMRVMGISRGNIFFFMILRSLAIGFVGAALTAVFGTAATLIISKFAAPCVIAPEDLAAVAIACVVGSVVGVFLPAWRASRLDPVQVITDSRIH